MMLLAQRRELPKDCARFLMSWYNKKNSDNTPTTPIEIAEATRSYEAAWERHELGVIWR